MEKSWLLLVLIVVVFLESGYHVDSILRYGLHHSRVFTLQTRGLIFFVKSIDHFRLIYDDIFMVKVNRLIQECHGLGSVVQVS